MSAFWDVLDIPAIAYAIGSGITAGATLVLWVSLRYPPRTVIATRQYAVITAGALLLLGTIFFAGQISQAVVSGDPQWIRALARYVLWDVFAVFVGIGLGIARSFAGEVVQ